MNTEELVAFNEWIDELFHYDLTTFIDTLIKDGSIPRHIIHYGYEDYIKPENRDVKEWYMIDDFFDKDDLEKDFTECDITYTIFGDRVFVGLITEKDDLHNDKYWNNLFKKLQ